MRCKFSPFFNDWVRNAKKSSNFWISKNYHFYMKKSLSTNICPWMSIFQENTVLTGFALGWWFPTGKIEKSYGWVRCFWPIFILKFGKFWCSLFFDRRYMYVHFCRICSDIAIFFFFNLWYHTFWFDIGKINAGDIIEKWATICISGVS